MGTRPARMVWNRLSGHVIDVADLPEPVSRFVAETAWMPRNTACLACRTEAATRLHAAIQMFAHEEWAQAELLLALTIGYLTAADRFAEEAAA